MYIIASWCNVKRRFVLVFAALLLAMAFILGACSNSDIGDESAENSDNGQNSIVSKDESVEEPSRSESSRPTEEPLPELVENFDDDGKYIPLNYEKQTIMKLTQWDLCNGTLLSGNNQRDERTFRNAVKKIMKNISDDGFNTVLLQVRPFGDSFYQSEYYPLSYFVTGSYSKQTLKYDPVEIFVELAHRYDISIHAWINPMRCMTKAEMEKVEGDWAIKRWFSEMGTGSNLDQYMFENSDAGGSTRLYLNIAYPEVRQLIIDGVDEIVNNYKVDGVFMDDYFYPESVLQNTAIDSKAYSERTDGSENRFRFRCNNVNTLVSGIYSVVKAYDEKLIYGISPNGHIDYAYLNECADMYTWCANEGYIDVIYPQFYYGMLHGECDVVTLTEQWSKVIKNKNIKFVPVLTLHKAGAADQYAITEKGKSEWETYTDIILCSLTYLMTNDSIKTSGIGFFCYQYFHGTDNTFYASKEIASFDFLWKQYDSLNVSKTSELELIFSENNINLKDKIAEWNQRLTDAGKKAVFTAE